MTSKIYVLITAAKNEEAFIEKTISSVINQTILPKKWVIVNDGSTDRTVEIVTSYLTEFDFIKLINLRNGGTRNFCSKVYAVKHGFANIGDIEFNYIGNLDADISFEPHYYEAIFDRFENDPKLGIAGGFIFEKYKCRPGNSLSSVPGSIQFFRRETFDAFGGYIPLKYGGEDWYAEVMAKMKGWKVQSFPDLKVFHHRATGFVFKNTMQRNFQEGRKDFTVGSHPLFEIFKCIKRTKTQPYFFGSISRMSGFLYALLRREKILLPDETANYLRKEQLKRILRCF